MQARIMPLVKYGNGTIGRYYRRDMHRTVLASPTHQDQKREASGGDIDGNADHLTCGTWRMDRLRSDEN